MSGMKERSVHAKNVIEYDVYESYGIQRVNVS